MGYTHYWTIDPNRVSPEQFLEVAKDTKKIIKEKEAAQRAARQRAEATR